MGIWEIVSYEIVNLIECIPYLFGVYLIFDFTGSLLFGKK